MMRAPYVRHPGCTVPRMYNLRSTLRDAFELRRPTRNEKKVEGIRMAALQKESERSLVAHDE